MPRVRRLFHPAVVTASSHHAVVPWPPSNYCPCDCCGVERQTPMTSALTHAALSSSERHPGLADLRRSGRIRGAERRSEGAAAGDCRLEADPGPPSFCGGSQPSHK
ncbi:unnamed protein product [Mycena citricolor]|uniref:Uncharacterized protein n=1 Tax=Mycena citricolor TaxID=2018698 RepID=A0AAD2HEJ5_9AGAR|nr:unnamed protein product [Mycena citricolor]CAK5274222.1 unnamed protein product [Mycena citricolor]